MTIDKVLAVYKTTPIVLVVEPAEGPVCELSLRDPSPPLRLTGHGGVGPAWTPHPSGPGCGTCASR
jgi:hypothetical protein